MDILIFVDVSDTLLSIDPTNPKAERVSSLKITENYARNKKLPFPVIRYEEITKKAVDVFKDEKDLQAPVVIYQPHINRSTNVRELEVKHPELRSKIQALAGFNIDECFQQGICSSENFTYSPQQARALMLAGEVNMYGALESIVESIRWVAQQKNIVDVAKG